MDEDCDENDELILGVVLLLAGRLRTAAAVICIEAVESVSAADTEQQPRIAPLGDGLDTP